MSHQADDHAHVSAYRRLVNLQPSRNRRLVQASGQQCRDLMTPNGLGASSLGIVATSATDKAPRV